ncbi:unnamed protein product [Lota lota]
MTCWRRNVLCSAVVPQTLVSALPKALKPQSFPTTDPPGLPAVLAVAMELQPPLPRPPHPHHHPPCWACGGVRPQPPPRPNKDFDSQQGSEGSCFGHSKSFEGEEDWAVGIAKEKRK